MGSKRKKIIGFMYTSAESRRESQSRTK